VWTKRHDARDDSYFVEEGDGDVLRVHASEGWRVRVG
jgi:hypothetical protein